MDQLKRAAKGAAIFLLISACGAHADAVSVYPDAKDPRAGKVLTFGDEFNRLDIRRDGQGRWTPRFHMAGPNELGSRTLHTNKELQIYVDPEFAGTAQAPLGLNPFRIRNGRLLIRAERAAPAVSPHIWNYRYTSGLLTSFDSFTQTYGYFEIRARLPRGAGLWPAFWLLPANGEWPPEIDVLEALGQDPSTIHQSVHWSRGGEHALQHAEAKIDDGSKGFHTYGVDWTKTTIRWFIDGRETARAPTPPDLHQPAYLLLNLAVGEFVVETVAEGAFVGDEAGRSASGGRPSLVRRMSRYSLGSSPSGSNMASRTCR
jgi:beta-glucanase (GH16 family)